MKTMRSLLGVSYYKVSKVPTKATSGSPSKAVVASCSYLVLRLLPADDLRPGMVSPKCSGFQLR